MTKRIPKAMQFADAASGQPGPNNSMPRTGDDLPRHLRLRHLLEDLCDDDYGFDDAVTAMRSAQSCPRYALVSTNGVGGYWISLHATLDECCHQLVRQMNDDVPYRHREATDLDSGALHYFRLSATPERL